MSTDLTGRTALVTCDSRDIGHSLVAGQALARWADVVEMVGPVVFLASDASPYVAGQVLVVDGGQTTS